MRQKSKLLTQCSNTSLAIQLYTQFKDEIEGCIPDALEDQLE